MKSLHRTNTQVCLKLREMETSGIANPTTVQKPPGISVSVQTEASWLYEHAYKKSRKKQLCSKSRLFTCILSHRLPGAEMPAVGTLPFPQDLPAHQH